MHTYCCQPLRNLLQRLGIKPQIPRRGDSEQGLDKFPLVRRTHAQLAPSIPPTTYPLRPSTQDTPSLLVPRRRRRLLLHPDQQQLVLSPGS